MGSQNILWRSEATIHPYSGGPTGRGDPSAALCGGLRGQESEEMKRDSASSVYRGGPGLPLSRPYPRGTRIPGESENIRRTLGRRYCPVETLPI